MSVQYNQPAEEVYALICVCLWSGPFPSLLNARLWLGGINISAPGGKVITLIKWLTYYKRRLLEGKWRRDRVEKEAKQKKTSNIKTVGSSLNK